MNFNRGEGAAPTSEGKTAGFIRLLGQVNIPGIVTVGLFAKRPADVLLPGTQDGVKKLT